MTANTSNAKFQLLPNSNTGLASYSGVEQSATYSHSNSRVQLSFTSNTLRTNADNGWAVRIDNYASTTGFKPLAFYGRFVNAASSNNTVLGFGALVTTAAITNLEFNYEFGYTFSGGTIQLYGVK
jgi:hypothetical protein